MRIAPIVTSLAALAGLSACGSTSLFDRDRPDEFAVTRQPPLVIPPDFTLTPPRPGEPRPQVGGVQQQTLQAMFGGPAARSSSEAAVLDRAGTGDAGIRSSLGDPDTNTVDKGAVTRDIIAAPEGDGRTATAATPE